MDCRERTAIPEKNTLINYAKAFDCVDHNKLWKVLKEIKIPDHPTCMQVKKQQLEQDVEQRASFKIGKGIFQGCILSPCLFHLYAVYITWNVKLLVLQALIKIARRNINNFRYENDTTLMAESKEELKNLLMMVKEESEKSGLKLNVQKTKIKISDPITSW